MTAAARIGGERNDLKLIQRERRESCVGDDHGERRDLPMAIDEEKTKERKQPT